MPRSGGYGWVLVYYLVLGVVVAGVELFWKSVLGWRLSERLLAGDPGRMNDLIGFLLSPVLLIGALYLVTAVCHAALLMMRGATHGFETSSRVFAFAYSPALFNVVPVVGNLISLVWMSVLAIVGLRAAHETDGAKAAAAVLVPLFLLLALLVIAVIAAIVMGLLTTRI